MVINIKDCLVKIKDGSTHSIIVKIGEGNLTYTEHKPRQYVKDRGKLDTVRDADEEPMAVSLDATWEHITTQGVSGAVPTVEDAMKKRGPASAWTSSSSDPCEPYAVDIEITDDPECSIDMREILLLPDFRYEEVVHDLKAGTLKFTGKCNATEANPTRMAQTA